MPDVDANTTLRSQLAAREVTLPTGPLVSFEDIVKSHHISLEQLKWAVEREERRTKLTAREREVLIAYASGIEHGGIGGTLGCSPKTSRFHMQQCSKKLGLNSRVRALHYCILAGWIEPGHGLSNVARASAERQRLA